MIKFKNKDYWKLKTNYFDKPNKLIAKLVKKKLYVIKLVLK